MQYYSEYSAEHLKCKETGHGEGILICTSIFLACAGWMTQVLFCPSDGMRLFWISALEFLLIQIIGWRRVLHISPLLVFALGLTVLPWEKITSIGMMQSADIPATLAMGFTPCMILLLGCLRDCHKDKWPELKWEAFLVIVLPFATAIYLIHNNLGVQGLICLLICYATLFLAGPCPKKLVAFCVFLAVCVLAANLLCLPSTYIHLKEFFIDCRLPHPGPWGHCLQAFRQSPWLPGVKDRNGLGELLPQASQLIPAIFLSVGRILGILLVILVIVMDMTCVCWIVRNRTSTGAVVLGGSILWFNLNVIASCIMELPIDMTMTSCPENLLFVLGNTLLLGTTVNYLWKKR